MCTEIDDLLLFVKLINEQYNLDISQNEIEPKRKLEKDITMLLAEKTDLLNRIKVFGPGQQLFSIFSKKLRI